MICAVMQPTYIPWLGYFNLIQKTDAFVFLDNVKIEKCSWHVRNRIKGQNGEVMLTIPISTGRLALISETLTDNKQNWKDKHLKTIRQCYGKAPAFWEVFPVLENAYTESYDKLSDFTVRLIKTICNYTGIKTNFYLASELDVSGVKDELVLNICKKIKADSYLSPQGAAEYINREKPGGLFPENDIDLYYLNYEHPVYNQLYGNFIPYMGIYDLLLNVGFDEALRIIQSGDRQNLHYTDLK